MRNHGRPKQFKNRGTMTAYLEQEDIDYLDEIKGDLSRGELLSHLIRGESLVDAKSAASDENRVKTLESELSASIHKVEDLQLRLNTKKATAKDKIPVMINALRGVERRYGEIPGQMLLTWRNITGLSEEEISALVRQKSALHKRKPLSSEAEARLLRSKKHVPIKPSPAASKSKLVANGSTVVGFEKGKYLD